MKLDYTLIRKKVKCVQTGKEYKSVTAAAADTGVCISGVSHSLRSDGEKKKKGLSFTLA